MTLMGNARAVILAGLATASCSETSEEFQASQVETIESASRLAGAVTRLGYQLDYGDRSNVASLTEARTTQRPEEMRTSLEKVVAAKAELDLRYAEFLGDFRESIAQQEMSSGQK